MGWPGCAFNVLRGDCVRPAPPAAATAFTTVCECQALLAMARWSSIHNRVSTFFLLLQASPQARSTPRRSSGSLAGKGAQSELLPRQPLVVRWQARMRPCPCAAIASLSCQLAAPFPSQTVPHALPPVSAAPRARASPSGRAPSSVSATQPTRLCGTTAPTGHLVQW